MLAVGTVSVLASSAFPDQAGWSTCGNGYLFIPVFLPILGLLRLRRTAPRPDGTTAGGTPAAIS